MAIDMNQLMAQARQMQADIMSAQDELKDKEVSASAGGGMVKVVATGDLRIKSITIDPEAVDPDDVELLEDTIVAAVNEAIASANDLADQRMRSATGGLAGSIPGIL